jgi:hypothetical protein
MDGDVDHEGGSPVFYKRDVIFTHLAVDRLSAGTGSYLVPVNIALWQAYVGKASIVCVRYRVQKIKTLDL